MKTMSLLMIALLAGVAVPRHCGAESTVGSIEVDGVERTWRLFVPDGYQASNNHALVLDFHGTGGSPQGQERTSGFTQLAAQKGFLVVQPAGNYRRSADSGLSWNVDLDNKGVDDVRFVRALIAHLKTRYAIDPRRIYSTGFSGGARMSSRLACDLSDVIAAVGLVGGIRFPEQCTPQSPVAIIAIHSEDDEVNHFEHRADSPAYWPVGVNDAVSSWRTYNKCGTPPSEQQIAPGVMKFQYPSCKAGAELVFIKLKSGGHTWPGSPAAKERLALSNPGSGGDFSATDEVWKFFEQHPRR